MQSTTTNYGSITCSECPTTFVKASQNQVTCSPLCARRRERKRRKAKAANSGAVFQQQSALARATKVLENPTKEELLNTLRALRMLDLPEGVVVILGNLPEGWEKEEELAFALVQHPETGEWRMS